MSKPTDALNESQRRERNLAAVEAAFRSVGSADAVSQMTQYTDDLVLELPFANPFKRLEGKHSTIAYLNKAFMTYKMQLTITEVHLCLDPDELIVEFVSDGRLATTGKPYANRYINVFRFRGGKICFQREFFNPKISDAALTTAPAP